MGLRERVLEIGPSSFRPLEKSIEIMADLYGKGILAFPDEDRHWEYEGSTIDSIRFLIFKKGEFEKRKRLRLLFIHAPDKEMLVVSSHDKDAILLIVDAFEIKLNKEELSQLPPLMFNHSYELYIDFGLGVVEGMGPVYDENDPRYSPVWSGFRY